MVLYDNGNKMKRLAMKSYSATIYESTYDDIRIKCLLPNSLKQGKAGLKGVKRRQEG